MAHRRVKSTRFPGVYWRETTDPLRRHNGRPDRCYDYCVRTEGKLKWITAGWSSEGYSEQKAANLRREALTRLAQGKSLKDQSRLSLNEAATDYLAWLEGERKYAVQERCRYDLHIRDRLGSLPLSDLLPQAVDTVKAQILKTCSPATTKKVLSLCRAIVNHAARNGKWEGVNPFGRDRLKMPRLQNKGERFLTPQEAHELLDALEKRSPQLRDMAWLSLMTGLRSTEIFRLTGADVDIQSGVLWVTEKGGRRVVIKVGEEVLKTLAAYGRKDGEYIFPARNGSKKRQISYSFTRVCEELGLRQPGMDNRKKVWFHVLRHTFASWLAQSGKVTLQELRDLLRHSSITMTERYAHLIPGSTQAKASLVGNILKNESPDM